jgi:hypothetical protein
MSVNTPQGNINVNPEGVVEGFVNILGNANPTSSLEGTYQIYKIGNAHTASLLQGNIGNVDLQVFNGLETFINLTGTYDIRILIYADNTNIYADRTIITIDRI